MNAALIAAGSLVLLFLGYRFYSRFLERKVYRSNDPNEELPAHTMEDGIDFVPSKKHVLFGHHFSSIAGAAPILGQAIAVIWGWLPTLLWVVLGFI